MIPMFRPLVIPGAADAVAEVLASGYIGQGPVVEMFEGAFGEVVRATEPYPLATNSCTSALDLALHLIGVERKDFVISTPQTCTATNGVIVNRKAIILWADVDPLTGLIDPASVERLNNSYGPAKAIVAVDWAGRSADYAALKANGVPVVQDAAHVGPAPLRRPCGDYVAWSFQAIKHLTTGDGGALLVPPDQHRRAKLLRWYGLDRESSASFRCAQNITEVGYKYHMNDISAAIGLANLESARKSVAAHRHHALRFTLAWEGLPGIRVAPFDPHCSYWLYTMLVADRDAFVAHMTDEGIETSQVHARNDRHTAFRNNALGGLELPGLDLFSAHQVSVPVGWWLTSEDEDRIIRVVQEWSEKHGPEGEGVWEAGPLARNRKAGQGQGLAASADEGTLL